MTVKKQQIFLLWLIIFNCNLQLINGGVLFHFGFNFLIKDGNNDTSSIENNSTEIKDLINETTKAATLATVATTTQSNVNNDNKLNIKENQQNVQQITENVDKILIKNYEDNDDNNDNKDNNDDDQFAVDFITTVPTLTTIINSNTNTQISMLQKKLENYLKATKDAILNIKNIISVVVGRSDVIANKVKLMIRYLNEIELESNKSVQINKYTILRQFLILIDELQKPTNYGVNGERTMEYLLIKLLLEKYQVLSLKDDIEEILHKVENEWKHYVKEKLINISI